MAMAEPFDNWKFELSLVLPAQHSTAHTKMLSHDMGADMTASQLQHAATKQDAEIESTTARE
jgi:hypothetical protein